MALSLARMGGIQRAPIEDYDPFEEGRLRRRGAQLEEQGILDLAKSKRDAKEAQRALEAAAKEREVMGNYIASRETADQIPVGVASPRLFKERPQGMGPQPEGTPMFDRINPDLERDTILSLARINPDSAEKFRLGRQGEAWGLEDRSRKMGFEDQDQANENAARALAREQFDTNKGFKERELTNAEKQQIVANNLAWFQAHTGRQNANTSQLSALNSATKTNFKPLPQGAREALSTISGNATQLKNVFNTAQKDFFGKMIGGNKMKDLAIWAGGKGEDTQWWKRYQDYMNKMIKEFSGAAVTAPEAARLEKAFVTPQTDPMIAARSLKEAMQIIEAGNKKLAESYRAGGFYDPAEIEALLKDYGSEIPVSRVTGKVYLQDLLEDAELEELERKARGGN